MGFSSTLDLLLRTHLRPVHVLVRVVRGCAAELVEVDVEPVVHLAVDRVVLVADLTGSHVVRLRTRLRGCAILVRAADEQRVQTAFTAVARVRVGAQHTADEVAQVRHVVHVRKR